MLSAFVVAQLVFDVAVVALAAVYLVTKRPPPAPEPPEWYAHFLKLAQDLMTATEPVLEQLEMGGSGRGPIEMGGSGRPPGPPTLRARNESGAFASAAPPAPDRYEKARALLRTGARPEDVASHVGLAPGEIRLLTRIVAAEGRPRSR